MHDFLNVRESAKNLKKPQVMTFSAILAALYAISMTPVLGNIVIALGKIELRFGFLILAVAGMYLGPIPATIIAMVGDLVGTILFYGGDFFFGYTITWMIQAFVFALIFYKQKPSAPRVILAMVFNTLIVNLFFTTLWQSVMFKSTFWAVLLPRIPLNLILFIPRTLLMYFVMNAVEKLLQKAGHKLAI